MQELLTKLQQQIEDNHIKSIKHLYHILKQTNPFKTFEFPENEVNDLELQLKQKLLQEKLNKKLSIESIELEEHNLDNLINHWKQFKNIVVMCGAGISVNAGIPDYRSKGGFYDFIEEKYPEYRSCPEQVNSISFFLRNPSVFYDLYLQSNYQSLFHAKPTKTHEFLKWLHDNNQLLRVYTQNVDHLELQTGLDREYVIQVHGTNQTSRCHKCKQEYNTKEFFANEMHKQNHFLCTSCNKGRVRPNVILFGEQLDTKLLQFHRKDFKQCDLLLIMGTSLQVYPFASFIDLVPTSCYRVLVNKQLVAPFDQKTTKRPRDFAILQDCDTVVQQIM